MKRFLLLFLRLLGSKHFLGKLASTKGEMDWLPRLSSLAAQIDDVNNSTEAEFLEIGSKLEYIYQTSKEISQESAITVELLAGEEISAAIGGLRRISTNLERIASDSQHHSERLTDLLQMVDDVNAALNGFQRYVQRLNLLCVATRIEAAHLGSCEANFEDLADDIEKLTGEIETRCNAIRSRLDSLTALIRQSLSQILKIEDCQRGQTKMVLDQTSSSLAVLIEQYEKSLSTVKRIASGYDELSRITGEIVCSVQFHDITRQQIEHAAESLRLLSDPQHRAQKDLADLCELQSVQIRFAGKKLTEAVGQIISNLQSTAKKIMEMTGDLLKLAGDAEPARSLTGPDSAGSLPRQEELNFLCRTEDRLSLAGTVLRGYAEKNRDLLSAMDSISDALKDMSSFVGKIRQIGQAIRLIALNSIVKSSHVGDRGAALGVLANEIHHLSRDTGEQTQVISDAFESITSLAIQMGAEATNERGFSEGGTADEMIETLSLLTKSLSAANSAVMSRMATISKTAGDLVVEIETTASGINVHQRVATAISEIASKVDAAVVDLRASSPSINKSGSSARSVELMKELEQSYTMSSERELHQLVSSETGHAHGQSPEIIELPQVDEQELGDNVELF